MEINSFKIKMQIKVYIVLCLAILGVVNVRSQEECGARPTVGPKDCCEMSNSIDKEVVEKCAAELTNSTFINNLKCFSECVLTAMGAFDNGNIVKEALTKYLTTSIGSTQPSFVPVINSAVEFCLSHVSKINKNPSEGVEKQNGKKCNKISSVVLMCTKLQMIKHCPEDAYKKSEECGQLKKYVDNKCYRKNKGSSTPKTAE